jgi:NAD(P)-dependent dehydrogenase (short-subunit alcohol dehydrogenase family)
MNGKTTRGKRFQGKHVLITGAAQGIGHEIARQFASEGATITLFDRAAKTLKQTISKFKADGVGVYGTVVDVSKSQQVKAAVDRAERRMPIDILINNAGTSTPERNFLEMSDADWHSILDINLSSMFYLSRAVCRHMVKRRRGAIVNMGSICSFAAEFGYANYNVSKAGVVMLTQHLSLELAHVGIRVNAVCPGRIRTPLIAELEDPEVNQRFVDRFIPMDRDGTPEEVAPAFLFLASDEARFITGQTLVVDGGQLAGMKPDDRMLKRKGFDR